MGDILHNNHQVETKIQEHARKHDSCVMQVFN
jgi:hypothetical protein